jgi:hypothetical protein
MGDDRRAIIVSTASVWQPRRGYKTRRGVVVESGAMEGEVRERGQVDYWFHRWPAVLLGVSIGGSIAALLFSSGHYGGAQTWPPMITSFAATSIAFLIALAWDRRQRSIADTKDAEAEARRLQAEVEAEYERRRIEGQRRFSAIALELERLHASLERTVAEQQSYKYFFPDLPDGSWQAGSGALGMIISNFGLMADLSTFYGQVSELRWRLRFKADPSVEDADVSPIIDMLARQMLHDVEALTEQVRRQVVSPDLSPLVDEHGGVIVSARQPTGAIRTVVFERPTADST